ncbi:MAG: hypothetical protein HYV33_02620 [Candidatus Kerfeldbacteria bacterium]|nr:hypothetical protein [Candidatus Kerfeldbacteria bacterium]
MKKPWLAGLLNFFFMGLGTLYLGKRKPFGLVLTLGSFALTYVELSLKAVDINLYWIMFATVFVMNVLFTLDALREAKEINTAVK